MSPPLKLLFLASEFPYPPNHGGRSDTWQRLRAFADAGVDIQLVCWYSDRRGGAPSDAEVAAVQQVVRDLVVLPINIGIADLAWRLLNLGRMPSHISARTPRLGVGRRLLARIGAFAPAAVWLDGLWPAGFARTAAAHLGLPYFYRSHNIEHRYMAQQAALARSVLYRIRLGLTLIGLEAFERRVVLDAAEVFDISVSDLAHWRGQGLRLGQWLPPIVQIQPLPERTLRNTTRFDIVFVGNLHTPNNVEGLHWLLKEVWPRVREQRPQATALIAGSAPSEEIRALATRIAGVELRADPTDVWPLYRSGRVLVNPARTGSGVNIKSVEMLHLEQPIVSTSVGTGGLPDDVKRLFMVEDEPQRFAEAILRSLTAGTALVDEGAREKARQAFSPQAIQSVVNTIRNTTASRLPGEVPA